MVFTMNIPGKSADFEFWTRTPRLGQSRGRRNPHGTYYQRLAYK
jgi:hypothetical protein